jgi:hypothetical protein
MKANTLLSTALSPLVLAGVLQASQHTSYHTAEAFQSALNNSYPETFASLALGDTHISSLIFAGEGFFFEATVPFSTFWVLANPEFDRTLSTEEAYSIDFSVTGSPVTAMGGNFFVTNLHGAFIPNAAVTLTFRLQDEQQITQVLTPETPADTFFGITAPFNNPITSLEIAVNDDAHWPACGSLTVGTIPQPPTLGFLAWQGIHFTPEETAISGPAADADGDGVGNLLEYLFSSNPREADRSVLPVLGVEDGYLTLTYTRAAGTEDVTVTVLTSGDLGDWQPNAVFLRDRTGYEGTIRRTFRDAVPMTEGMRRFLRISATLE